MKRFDEWRCAFANGRRGQQALLQLNGKFSALGLNDIDLSDLRGDVLDHCYRAVMFTRDTDPYEARRRIYAKAISPKELKSWRSAIEKLRKKVRTNPEFAGKVFGRVVIDLKLATRTEAVKDASALLEEILDRLLIRSGPDIPSVTSGSMVQRYGCLSLGTRLLSKKNRRPQPETLLLFCLVQTFRICSSARARVRPQRGAGMPRKGKSFYDLAASLINAAFDKRAFGSGYTAKNRLERFVGDHRDALFIGWPR